MNHGLYSVLAMERCKKSALVWLFQNLDHYIKELGSSSDSKKERVETIRTILPPLLAKILESSQPGEIASSSFVVQCYVDYLHAEFDSLTRKGKPHIHRRRV